MPHAQDTRSVKINLLIINFQRKEEKYGTSQAQLIARRRKKGENFYQRYISFLLFLGTRFISCSQNFYAKLAAPSTFSKYNGKIIELCALQK